MPGFSGGPGTPAGNVGRPALATRQPAGRVTAVIASASQQMQAARPMEDPTGWTLTLQEFDMVMRPGTYHASKAARTCDQMIAWGCDAADVQALRTDWGI